MGNRNKSKNNNGRDVKKMKTQKHPPTPLNAKTSPKNTTKKPQQKETMLTGITKSIGGFQQSCVAEFQ